MVEEDKVLEELLQRGKPALKKNKINFFLFGLPPSVAHNGKLCERISGQ